jgi:molybdopterin converting factor small subunit
LKKTPLITVEFYGVPRQRAGRPELAVRAAQLGEALHAVQQACPKLSDLINADGRLASHYLLSIDGAGFVTDMDETLESGARVLLLSADAGG